MNWFLLYAFSKSTAGSYFEFVATISIFGAVIFGGYAKYVVREVAINAVSIWKFNDSIKYWVGIGAIISGATLGLLALTNKLSYINGMYLIWTPLLAYLALVSALLRGLGSHIYGNIEAGVIRPLVFMMIILAVLSCGVEIGVQELLALGLVALFVDALLMHYLFVHKKKTKTPVMNSSKNNYKSIFKLSAISLIEVAFVNLDLVVIAVLMNQENVAIYKVVLLLRSALLLPTMTFSMLMPYLLSTGKVVPRQLILIRLINLLIGLVGLLINWKYGTYMIVLIFGDGYASASNLLYPFFAMMVVLSISGPSLEYLVAKKKEGIVLTFMAGLMISSLIFNLVFYRDYGLMAFSLSGAFAYASAHLLSEIYRRKYI
jgi:O-antigen/teichoic acid export membrane protein